MNRINGTPGTPHLRVDGLHKLYKQREVLRGVSLEFAPGEVVGLLGPNGAGKTTTFYCILGLITPNQGRISLGDENISELPMYLRARRGIGYLPQEPSVFRRMSVSDNIMAVLELHEKDQEVRAERLRALLTEFKLSHVAQSPGYVLSGGERRRTEIARALALNPTFILLDEPFAGIDPLSVMDIQHMILDLKKRGIGVIITDHNVRETLRITDRAYILREGEIFRQGRPGELAADPAVRASYLGENFTL